MGKLSLTEKSMRENIANGIYREEALRRFNAGRFNCNAVSSGGKRKVRLRK